MFSIIDNEIKLKFEILGGMDEADADAQAEEVAPVVAPTGPIAAILAELDALVASGAMSQAAATIGFQQFAAISGNAHLKTAAAAMPAVSQADIAAAASAAGVQHVSHDEQDEQEEEHPDAPPPVSPVVADLGGGALNDALSKDIQYKLIGGSVEVGSALYQMLARRPANERYAKKPYANFGAWFVATMWQLHTNSRLGAEHAAEDEWDVSTNVPLMSEFTKRDDNGKLQIKVGDKHVSLNDYWLSTNNGNKLAKALEGRKRDRPWDNKDTAECFVKGAPMFNEDGSVARDDCVDAITDKDLWKTSAKEVADMHPKVVFDILKSLGFKGVPTNKGIRCQSYNSWVSSLKSGQKTALKFTGNQFDNADFVKNLVAFMNANPAILNKGDLPKNAKADLYGVKPATWNKRIDNSFDDLRYRINDAYDTVRFRVHGLTGAFPAGFATFRGGAAPAYLFPSRSNNRVENLPKFSAQLRNIYKSLVSRLKRNNKTLGDLTKKQIEDIFESLERHEGEAVKLITELEQYYLSTNGDRSPGLITNSAMAKAVQHFEKNMHKLRKRAINIVDIQSVLNTAVNDAETAQSNFGSFQE